MIFPRTVFSFLDLFSKPLEGIFLLLSKMREGATNNVQFQTVLDGPNHKFKNCFKMFVASKIILTIWKCWVVHMLDVLLLIVKCPFHKIQILWWATSALELLIDSNIHLNFRETFPLNNKLTLLYFTLMFANWFSGPAKWWGGVRIENWWRIFQLNPDSTAGATGGT